jgi:hypothetical protein
MEYELVNSEKHISTISHIVDECYLISIFAVIAAADNFELFNLLARLSATDP